MMLMDYAKAVVWTAFMGAMLFLPAGTVHWRGAWIFMAEFVLAALVITLWLARYDRGLLKERMSGLFQRGQPVSDKVFVAFIIVVWHAWLSRGSADSA